MAGNVKVAVVSGAISSSGTGTADFTKSGFGTPKACIVLLSFDTADDTSVAVEGKASIGFSDFTNHRCISHQDEDASAKVDCDARKSATKAYVLLDVGGVVDIDGTLSTITDGVRLTNTTNGSSSAVFATVIMFGGADLQVSLDSITTPNAIDGTTLVTTGIPQDLIFFIGTDIAGEDTSSTGIGNSFGVVDISNDQATIVNRCMGWASDHNANNGRPASVVRNDRCLKILTEPGGDDWGIEVTVATTTSYTITERDVASGNGMEVYALALDLDDRGSKVGSVDSPISGASWTPSVALGFTPQYVGLGLTSVSDENIIDISSTAGALGISSNTGSGEETCNSWYNEDAAAIMNTNNLFRSRVIDFRSDDVINIIHDHSHSSFNSGDWTYTINSEFEFVGKKWFYWAIEESAAAGPTTRIKTVDLDAKVLEQALLKTVDLDAKVLEQGIVKTVDLDALVLVQFTKTVDLDALVLELARLRTIDLDAKVFEADLIRTVDLDALVLVQFQKTVDLDAKVFRAGLTVTVNLDAVVTGGAAPATANWNPDFDPYFMTEEGDS